MTLIKEYNSHDKSSNYDQRPYNVAWYFISLRICLLLLQGPRNPAS